MNVEATLVSRKFRRQLLREAEGKTLMQKLLLCQKAAHHLVYPMNDAEKALSDEIVANIGNADDWFHGGLPGRKAGDVLTPAQEHGLNARGAGDFVTNRHRAVYFTSEIVVARLYARRVKHGQGVVYRVMPDGPIEVDTNDLRTITLMTLFMPIRHAGELIPHLPVHSFCAPKAFVLTEINA